MALIPSIFTQFTPNDINQNTTTATDVSAAVSDVSKQAVLDMIDSLSVGDTILGKVTAQTDKTLSILTQDGVTLNAQNSSSINFEKGSLILFEIQKVSGRDISIRPLYQNTSMQNTAESALKQAGLPVNERTLEMTARNMEYGNPIDRNSLSMSYRDVALYPEASVKAIVDLQKMDIPVNDATITQYKAYMNMENSVTEAFSSISDSLVNDLVNELSTGSEASHAEMFTALSNILDNVSSLEQPAVSQNIATDLSSIVNEAHELGVELPELEKLLSDAEGDAKTTSYIDALKSFVNDISEGKAYVAPETVLTEQAEESKEGLSPLRTPENPVNQNNAQTANINLNENANPSQENITADITKLLGKDSVKALFAKALSNEWSVDVEKLKDKAEVKSLYDKLYNDTRNLLNAINENSDKFPEAKAGIANLRENIEFMNDLNQYVPYIQIPFHNDENNANSELYVFKNGKNLASPDGELTAFIHLDMANLGPTDVYVKMRDAHITTNFTMKDEETLLFIEHHMDYLDRRLNEKGYSFEAKVSVKDNEKSPIDKMLEENERHLIFSDISFDARV